MDMALFSLLNVRINKNKTLYTNKNIYINVIAIPVTNRNILAVKSIEIQVVTGFLCFLEMRCGLNVLFIFIYFVSSFL